jgi:plastocyanin
MRLRGLVALAAAAAFILAPSGAPSVADNPRLLATVGPGFTIRLTHPDGSAVTKVDPGVYDISVRDLDGEHNFHLSGQGVNEFTDVEELVNVTWTVTFAEARYTFVCDPHASDMRGEFVAGNPPAPAPPPTPTPAPAVKRLTLTVGPTATISLTNAAGKRITSTKAGAYTLTVRDRSKVHNAHLLGKGVNRKTTLAGTGTQTWKVKLSAGLLRFFSDRSPTKVKGAIRVT